MIKSELEIIKKISRELTNLKDKSNTDRLEYISKKKIQTKFKCQNIYSNGVYLLKNYLVAKKLFSNANGYILWKNEINSLKRVYNYRHFPQLIAVDPRNLIIYTTYCGKSLDNPVKLPLNWKQQYNQIKKTLLTCQINPNDILPRNICVLHDTIFIIDFGLSNINYKEILNSCQKLYTILDNYA
jgi:hypothetical protein